MEFMKITPLLTALLVLPLAAPAMAQNAKAPVKIDPTGKTVLMADDLAKPAAGIVPFQPNGPAKYFQRFYSTGWTKTDQELTWQVSGAKAGSYEVELVSRQVPEVVLRGGKQPLRAVIPSPSGWSRSVLGTVELETGSNTLTLQLAKDQAQAGTLSSMNLIPVAAKAGYQKRVDALRSDTAWMREGKYGVMLQYGGWGYPEHGDKKPWEQVVKDFDVEKFAKTVDEDMGAKWVIWSITWRNSHFPMPLKSVDAIVPGHTTTRDLPADLAAALKKRGIRMMFYYHPGHEDKAWWEANWGKDDKARFLKNWCAVVSEIGNRYGDDLAGWFFDDGAVYSPAPFEVLTKAAKSGSPKRLVSYNSWVLPVVTDFQDVHMGEMYSPATNADMDANGIYQSGPLKGNQSHAMMTVNTSGWGVWQPNTRIPLRMSAQQAIGLVQRGVKRGEAVSLNFDMYEDGTITAPTLDMFRQLKKAIRGPRPVSELQAASASSEWAAPFAANQANDGDPSTFWSLGKNQKTGWLAIDMKQPATVSRIALAEGRKALVTKFTVEAEQADGTWLAVTEGTEIGTEKEFDVSPVTAQKFRLTILDSKADADGSAPMIAEFQLFAK